jgi:hypothetical protein
MVAQRSFDFEKPQPWPAKAATASEARAARGDATKSSTGGGPACIYKTVFTFL